jgi:hypothetical protein
MSRAYYAVFHYFRDFFEQGGISLGHPTEADAILQIALENCGFPEVQKVAAALKQLSLRRLIADYQAGIPLGNTSAKQMIQQADLIVANFRAVLNSISAGDLTDAVKRHLASVGSLRTEI